MGREATVLASPGSLSWLLFFKRLVLFCVSKDSPDKRRMTPREGQTVRLARTSICVAVVATSLRSRISWEDSSNTCCLAVYLAVEGQPSVPASVAWRGLSIGVGFKRAWGWLCHRLLPIGFWNPLRFRHLPHKRLACP